MSKTSYVFRTFRQKQIAAARAIEADKMLKSEDALFLTLDAALVVRNVPEMETARESATNAALLFKMEPATQAALFALGTVGRVA